MRPKTIATGLLLAFVVLSIGVLVGKELRPGATRTEGVAPPASRIAQAKAGIPAPRVIAYYFHGTARCVTCKKIEAFAREAIGESFPDQPPQHAGILNLTPWVDVDKREPLTRR